MTSPDRNLDQGHVRCFDPASTPISRRTTLRAMAVGAVAIGGGLPVLLAACGGPGQSFAPTWVTLDIDPASLPINDPQEIAFEVRTSAGTFRGSTWVVRRSDAEVTAFSPVCTHRPCAYAWSSDDRRFTCTCHDGTFDSDGQVLGGPPPRPLDRFPSRIAGGRLDVEVLVPVRPADG
jgi:Rieske Fe-S protein